jgi:hypothetical protein
VAGLNVEVRAVFWLTQLRESNKLAAILASFIDPVDGLLDRELEVQPTRFGVDGGSLVLLGHDWGHSESVELLIGNGCLWMSLMIAMMMMMMV